MDSFTAAAPQDYQANLLAASPPGDAFSSDPASLRGQVIGAMGDGLSRAEQVAIDLVVRELDPRTATYMLPDWQALTGIAAQPTHAQTVALIMARIRTSGGMSIQHFIDLAASIGFTITITRQSSLRCGFRLGAECGAADADFVWYVNAPLVNYAHACAGALRCGEPLATWGSAVLEQIIRRYQPSIGFVSFLYQ